MQERKKPTEEVFSAAYKHVCLKEPLCTKKLFAHHMVLQGFLLNDKTFCPLDLQKSMLSLHKIYKYQRSEEIKADFEKIKFGRRGGRVLLRK